MAASTFELAARLRKAEAIAALLAAAGVRPDEAALMDDAGRRSAAALAGVRPPSPTTWELAVAHLFNIEHAVALVLP